MRNSCDVFIGPGVNISTSSSESHAKIFILVFVVQKFSSWCFLGKNINFLTRFSLCLDSVHWKPHYSISSKCSDEYPVLSCTSSSIRHDALLYIQQHQHSLMPMLMLSRWADELMLMQMVKLMLMLMLMLNRLVVLHISRWTDADAYDDADAKLSRWTYKQSSIVPRTTLFYLDKKFIICG